MLRPIHRPSQRFLRRIGLYHRLKTSCLYDFYWRVANRDVLNATLEEVAFYRKLLHGFRQGDLIFDVGANHGHKTDVFLRLGARVVAVDPDDDNQKVLTKRFLTLRLFKKPVIIVAKAVSASDAVATLWVDAPGCAKNTLSQKWVDTLRVDERRFGARMSFATQKSVETVSLRSLIAQYGVPFFIKIDVEGHELEVLRGLRRPVPFVSFEVNLPEFKAEGDKCIDLLDLLAPEGKFNYAVDCRRGLVLNDWLDRRTFLRTFADCTEDCIEVFWTTLAR